jgi:hypothetical protein
MRAQVGDERHCSSSSKTLTVSPGEAKFLDIDPPRGEQKVKVTVSALLNGEFEPDSAGSTLQIVG